MAKKIVKVAAPKIKKSADLSGYVSRVNRIYGQVGGIKKMVESDKDRVEVLVQLKAARAAIKGLEALILEEHFQVTVNELATGSAAQKSKKILELQKIFLKAE